jgi:hypothetical protein
MLEIPLHTQETLMKYVITTTILYGIQVSGLSERLNRCRGEINWRTRSYLANGAMSSGCVKIDETRWVTDCGHRRSMVRDHIRLRTSAEVNLLKAGR